MINFLKFIYIHFGLVHLKKYFSIFLYRILKKNTNKYSNIKEFSIDSFHTFFGYYDINPISNNNLKLLSIAVSKNKKNKIAKVGYFDMSSDNFVQLGTTLTWCWQQGCRLRWSKKNNKNIFYNCIVNNQYGSVLQNIYSKKILTEINFPLYDINSKEDFGLSLNFSRLQRLRPGYGYVNFQDHTILEATPSDDGVFLIDIHKNTSKLIIDIKSISKIKAHISMKDSNHYINHLSWNPSGERFLFFHLWCNSINRYSRLFTCDKNGKNLCLIENTENVSHYSWVNNNKIIVTTASKKNGIRYRIYEDQTSEFINLSNDLNKDGHPSFNPKNTNLFLSDTYPDKYSERQIFLFHTKLSKKIDLIKVYSPYKYRLHYRCDLHPRWSNDGKIVCFDSTHTGIRTINLINLEEKNILEDYEC